MSYVASAMLYPSRTVSIQIATVSLSFFSQVCPICGNSLPGVIRSSGSMMVVMFSTDTSGNNFGFGASFSSVEGPGEELGCALLEHGDYSSVYYTELVTL